MTMWGDGFIKSTFKIVPSGLKEIVDRHGKLSKYSYVTEHVNGN